MVPPNAATAHYITGAVEAIRATWLGSGGPHDGLDVRVAALQRVSTAIAASTSALFWRQLPASIPTLDQSCTEISKLLGPSIPVRENGGYRKMTRAAGSGLYGCRFCGMGGSSRIKVMVTRRFAAI